MSLDMDDIEDVLGDISLSDDDDLPSWETSSKPKRGAKKPARSSTKSSGKTGARSTGGRSTGSAGRSTGSAARSTGSAARSTGSGRATRPAPAKTASRSAARATRTRGGDAPARARKPKDIDDDDIDIGDIDDIYSEAAAEAGAEEFDLPDWKSGNYGKGRKKKIVPKGEWRSGGSGKKKESYREQLKKGMVPKAAREEDSDDDSATRSYRASRPGTTDVVDRLTDSKGYGGTHKNRFGKDGTGRGLKGRDMGNETVIKDLSDITRTSSRKPAGARKTYPRRARDDEPVGADYDDTEYEGDLEEANTGLDVGEFTAEDEAELIRQAQEELEGDTFGLPDFKSGKYRNKNTPAPRKVAKPKDKKKGAVNMRQQLKAGKEVLSARQQMERDAYDEKHKIVECAVAGCDTDAVNGRHCEKHKKLNRHNPAMLRKARDLKRQEVEGDQPVEVHECFGCGRALSGEMCQAMDQLWHPACFKCRKCRKAFPNGKFINMDGWPHCKPCAMKENAKKQKASGGGGGRAGARGGAADKCAGCKKLIGESGVKANGASWHPACFVCAHCGARFPGGKFVSSGGVPYCNADCFELAQQ